MEAAPRRSVPGGHTGRGLLLHNVDVTPGEKASARCDIHQGPTKLRVSLTEPFKRCLPTSCSANSGLNPRRLRQSAATTRRDPAVTFCPVHVGCCLGRTRYLPAVRHKRLYVFRVVSLNLERLCRESCDRKGRSVCESTSATFGAEFRPPLCFSHSEEDF